MAAFLCWGNAVYCVYICPKRRRFMNTEGTFLQDRVQVALVFMLLIFAAIACGLHS
jgi:hypothetical protein